MKSIVLSLLIVAALALPAYAETEWTLRVHIIVPISDAERMRAIEADYDPDPASMGGFIVRLSPTGAEPATHVGTNAVFTEAMLTKFRKALAEPVKSGLTTAPKFWRLEAKTEEIKESNVSVVVDGWAFDKTLRDVGLQIIRDEAPGAFGPKVRK